MLGWLKKIISTLVAYYVRPRNLGLMLLRSSCALFLLLAGGGGLNLVVKLANSSQEYSISWGEGPGAAAYWILLAVATVGCCVGYCIAKRHDDHMLEINQISRVLVAELRGLVDTSDYPLRKAMPQNITGRRVDCSVDIRRLVTGPEPNISEALLELSDFRRQIRRDRGGTSCEHITVVAGGVMQVSLLFYAGVLLDDEGKVLLFEWERASNNWLELSEPDNGQRFSISGLDRVSAHSADVVVAVSATYLADLAAISHTFPEVPMIHLKLPNPKPNTLWSEENQVELARQFTELMAELANRDVGTVHLILAAPPTLCIRLGRAYDRRNMPSINCYQRERDHVPQYPWYVRFEGVEPGKFGQTPTHAPNH
ncbi:SAVED domain-containing protein [Advenella kashmirensis]